MVSRLKISLPAMGFCMAVIGMLAGGFLVTPTPARAALPDSINVAVVVPLSGGLAAAGQKIQKGLDQYVAGINAGGGIGGKTKINVIYGDSKLNPTEGAVVTQRIINRNKIGLYIGNFSSSVSLATQPILARAGIIQATFSYAPALTRKGIRSTVRIGPYSRIEMVPMAKYAVENRGARRFAALALNNDWGRDMVAEFKAAAKKFNSSVEFVSEDYYRWGTKDFSSYLTKIKSLGVDGLVLMNFEPSAVQITKQFKDLGMKTQIFGSDLYAGGDYGKATAGRNEGIVFTDFWWRSAKGAPSYIQKYYRDYRGKYGEDPDSLSIWGRLGMEIFVQAAESVNSIERDAILTEILRGRTFNTVIGRIQFASCGQAKITNGVATWKGGRQVYLEKKGFGKEQVGYCD